MTGRPSFEGAEKKLNLVVAKQAGDLRDLGQAFWFDVVARAGATVLAHLETESGDAYVLSESSLFVFPRRVLMLTCGRTTMVEAAEAILERLPVQDLEEFLYKRKNELLPHLQPSSFYEDAARLAESMPGRAYRFGHPDEHHLMVFALDCVAPPTQQQTTEVSLYGLGVAADYHVPLRRRLAEILPGFTVQEHHFESIGYSANAIQGESYWALHVSPETTGSYASLETNAASSEATVDALIQALCQVFAPRSLDVAVMAQGRGAGGSPAGFQRLSRSGGTLPNGYGVSLDWFRRLDLPRTAAEAL